MSNVFLKLLNMSLTAGVMALVVMVLRLVLKKAPKWIFCVMWGLVALRLVLPFSIESVLSLMPSAEPIPSEILYSAEPAIDTGIPALDNLAKPVLQEASLMTIVTGVNPLQTWTEVIALIWLIGAIAMIIYAIVSAALLKRKLRDATLYAPGIKQSAHAASPFVLGIIKPVIYLPYEVGEADLTHIIAHEKAHIARKDHWWKPLGFLLLAIYWFNPVLWLAYILLCRDIEAACDEKVVRELDGDALRAYSTALLNASIPRRRIAACPLAFGEVGVKERIKNVMNYKKPAFWIIMAALVACVVTAVCLLTSPSKKEYQPKYLNFCYTAGTEAESARKVRISSRNKQKIAQAFQNAAWIDDSYWWTSHIDGSGDPEKFLRNFDYDYIFEFKDRVIHYNSIDGRCIDADRFSFGTLSYEDQTSINEILNVPDAVSCFPELVAYHVPDTAKLSISVNENRLYSEEPRLQIRWRNLGDEDFTFGEGVSLYLISGGSMTPVIPAYDTNGLLSFGVPANGYSDFPIRLDRYDLGEGETYRLYMCNGGTGTSEYWIEFVYGAGYDTLQKSASLWNEPPTMTVKNSSNRLAAKTGTYSWHYTDLYERFFGVEMDYADFFLVSPNLPTFSASAGESRVSLSFGPIDPDSIEVSYWDIEWKPVETVEGFSFELLEGNYTYRVIAHFSCGTVYYGFNGNR